MIHRQVRNRRGRLRAAASLCCALALIASAGCSSEPSEETAPSQVTFRLDFGSGVMLSSVNFTLTGPSGFRRVGTLAVGTDPTVTTTFQNLPPGMGYDVVVEGTATDDHAGCTGEAMFNVTASMTAVVTVPLICSGIVAITATTNVCPQIDQLSAIPSQVMVGSAIHLTAAAHDPDNQPGALTPTWTSSGGVLSATSATGATFTCTAPGSFTVGLRVSDGDASSGCPDSLAVTLVCAPAMSVAPLARPASTERMART